jgi:alkylated DNA repair protein (DNA oxidative demethylase)
VTDAAKGYRYEPLHPVTGRAWPDIPEILLKLWAEVAAYPAPPEACLVNLYGANARMGLHQDKDEEALDAPVLAVSLGDVGIFRFGATRRGTATLKLNSGDVLVFGGPARLIYHGIGRILPGTSTLSPDGGRINLTLRRVTKKKGDRSGG